MIVATHPDKRKMLEFSKTHKINGEYIDKRKGAMFEYILDFL